MDLPIFKTAADLRAHLLPFRTQRIALVPTMGALHDGHLQLMRQAAEVADHVLVSIFVNPTQFGPNEDFGSYPRDLVGDAKLISNLGIKNLAIFAPEVSEIYAEPSRTQIDLGDIASRWDGAARPGHFAGVALVVTKLFHLVQPNIAIFGQKDFQQLQVIQQFVRDFSFPIEIIGAEIVREATGLAMSSRNAYLTAEERSVTGPKIFQFLNAAADEIRAGGDADKVTDKYKQQLLSAGFSNVDYFAYVDSKTLAPLMHVSSQASRLLVAARLGKARLIDNIAVS